MKEPSELLGATAEYMAQRGHEGLVIAIEVSYPPPNGAEVFWLYDRVSHFEGHAALQREDGSMVVRSCDVPRSRVMEFLDLDQFFQWPDAISECEEGLCFEIAISEATRGHAVSGMDIATTDQPQVQLFWRIVELFPQWDGEVGERAP